MKQIALKTIAVVLTLAATSAFSAGNGAPFEQTQFDRGSRSETQGQVSPPASSGASVVRSGALTSGAWANDYNFIAPAR